MTLDLSDVNIFVVSSLPLTTSVGFSSSPSQLFSYGKPLFISNTPLVVSSMAFIARPYPVRHEQPPERRPVIEILRLRIISRLQLFAILDAIVKLGAFR